jgi:phosphotransferase system enzyme I (PtsI)
MIEVPSAVATAHHIAREVDFFSLGTNDLIQYTLAVDRGNEAVAPWFRTLHPAVLQSISCALRAAQANGIPAIVCGEMAATPAYAVILLGLGATELSMMPAAIPRLRHILSGIKLTEARDLAQTTLEFATADDVEQFVADEFSRLWPHLFTTRNLPRSLASRTNLHT